MSAPPEDDLDPLTTAEVDDAPSASGLRDRASRVISDAKRYLPWGSLAVGIGGALLMDRSPKGAWIVLVSAVLGWTAMWGFALVGRLDPADYSGRRRKLVVAARFASLVVTQSLIQNCLLFSLPFYVQATTLDPLQIGFLLTMLAIVVISLWDPFYERAVRGRVAALGFMGFATFCGLNAVLPPLGLGNGASLIVSGLFAAIGVPLQTIALTPPAQRKRRKLIVGGFVAVVVSLALAFGGARFIPPAPMQLSSMAIGTELVDKQVEEPVGEVTGLPKVLYCATAIASPRGVKDRLFHVWRKDGDVKDEVELRVSGGRKEGFRTWSKKTRLGRDPFGTWTCSVETKAGQLLGRRTVEVRPPAKSDVTGS
jgi:hypothetical protein